MSRIYNSVTSYLPFGRKAPPPEPEKKPEEVVHADEAPVSTDSVFTNGDSVLVSAGGGDSTNAVKPPPEGSVTKEDDNQDLRSNKKTDEVYDQKAQPGLIRWAAGGLVGAAGGAVGYGVGGIKWVANTGYSATSTVVTTTTGVIKKVPQVIKRKDKKE